MADMSLMEFLMQLLSPSAEGVQLRDYFAAEPQKALAEYGLENLTPADVHDALTLVQDNQTADFSRHLDSGGNSITVPAATHGGSAGEHADHQAAVDYLDRFITNNYVDDRDTHVDNSLNQQVDTHGGNFDQDVDVHSTVVSGDRAVGAGGDIKDSTLVSGNDNQVGDGNVRGDGNVVGDHNGVVQGDHDTTAFGSGAANSASFDHVAVDHGGALSVGGDSHGSYDVSSSYNTNDTHNTTTTDVSDSYNTDNDSSYESHTTTHTSTDSHDTDETDVLSHNHSDATFHS